MRPVSSLGATPTAASPTDVPPTNLPMPTERSVLLDVEWMSGVLGAPGVAETQGRLGGYTLDFQGSAAGWLPWKPSAVVAIPGGVPVTIRLGDAAPIGSWGAVIAPEADTTGDELTVVGEREADDPPLDVVRLDSLPPGRWVLAVTLRRADGRGDGVTFWSVEVAP